MGHREKTLKTLFKMLMFVARCCGYLIHMVSKLRGKYLSQKVKKYYSKF